MDIVLNLIQDYLEDSLQREAYKAFLYLPRDIYNSLLNQFSEKELNDYLGIEAKPIDLNYMMLAANPVEVEDLGTLLVN